MSLDKIMGPVLAQTAENADSQIRQIQNELFKVYLDGLLRAYERVAPDDRQKMMHALKGMIKQKLVYGQEIIAQEPNGKYEPKKALKLRKNLELTRREVCNEIGGLHEITLYKYETGQLKVTPLWKNCTGYVRWLYENGYNPFKIKNEETK